MEKLPLLLGLLVDCLILLAALASHRGGGGGGLVEELHWEVSCYLRHPTGLRLLLDSPA